MMRHQDAVSVFLSFIDKDERLLQKLKAHLSLLKRQGLISTWDSREIIPGRDRIKEIDQRLEHASLILLIVSAEFLASDYCYEMEMQRALQRHAAGQAHVIPIIVRPVDWEMTPLAHLQPLPTSAKAITSWSRQDEAWVDVAKGIRKALEMLRLLHGVAEEQEARNREHEALVQFVQQRASNTVTQLRKIRVFLSAPSDVNRERKNAQLACERLQRDAVLMRLIEPEIVTWDRQEGVILAENQTPQNGVNRQLPRPSECDIVVVILWSRMDTTLPSYGFLNSDEIAYRSGTEWVFHDAVHESSRSGFLPTVLLYRCTIEQTVKLHDPQKGEIERQQKLVDEFFDSLSTLSGTTMNTYNSYTYATREEFQNHLEEHLRQAIAAILKHESHPQAIDQARPVDIASEPGWNEPPFPGLRPFTRNDAPLYFGREQEIEELVTKIQQNRLTAVVGASGSGKSSLVWAGLIPRLADDVEVICLTPAEIRDDPFEAMATTMINMLREKYKQVEMSVDNLQRELCDETTSLDEICARILQAGKPTPIEIDLKPPRPKELLIFIDQFEELFTLVKTGLRDAFVRTITQAQGAQHFRVIMTMRAEFYHECLKWEDLSQLLQSGSYPLSLPGLPALHRMITEPARIAGFLFDRNLPEMILVDASINSGALPLMAYALRELYDHSKRRNDRRLTLADYQEMGGLAGAIGKMAHGLFPQLSASQQEALYTVFLKLLTVNDQGVATRKRAKMNSFTPLEQQLVNKLVQGRLLVSDTDDKKDNSIEVAHEALFSSWNILSEWLSQTRDQQILLRQMQEAVINWKKAPPEQRDSLLWHGERLKNAKAAVDHLQFILTSDEAKFLIPEVKRLAEKLLSVSLTHDDREDIGHQLNRIDDTRSGVGLRSDSLPDIAWFGVSAGEVTLDGVNHTFVVDPFYISCYTITFRQFQTFVDDLNGIQNMDWWNSLERSYPDIARQRFRYDNYPRTNVNWFQAVAFCHWLNARLPKADLPEGGRANWTIRLPCEWEWQQAGYGGQVGALYPWGDGKEGAVLCNDQESGFNKPIAVGMYPHGNAFDEKQGVADMLGNVAQWCHNCFENPLETGLKGMKRRAVRGCDFSQSAISTNLIYRGNLDPAKMEDTIGFRVVYAPLQNLNV